MAQIKGTEADRVVNFILVPLLSSVSDARTQSGICRGSPRQTAPDYLLKLFLLLETN
jgi:hypothetical protein